MGKIIYRLAFLMVNKYYVVMRFKFQFFQLLRFLYTSWDTPEVFPLNFIHSLLIKKKNSACKFDRTVVLGVHKILTK